MGIKTYNPYTPSRRNMTGLDFVEITKSTPEKSLLAKKDKTAGRNNQGKITVRHHGGGNRQKYRMIDFKRRKDDIPAKVAAIEYDPNRTANIALLHYADGEKAYIIAPVGRCIWVICLNSHFSSPFESQFIIVLLLHIAFNLKDLRTIRYLRSQL